MNKKLIIDGNAVYEIDLDCLDCLEQEKIVRAASEKEEKNKDK